VLSAGCSPTIYERKEPTGRDERTPKTLYVLRSSISSGLWRTAHRVVFRANRTYVPGGGERRRSSGGRRSTRRRGRWGGRGRSRGHRRRGPSSIYRRPPLPRSHANGYPSGLCFSSSSDASRRRRRRRGQRLEYIYIYML
jgi:hypothetical protein